MNRLMMIVNSVSFVKGFEGIEPVEEEEIEHDSPINVNVFVLPHVRDINLERQTQECFIIGLSAVNPLNIICSCACQTNSVR